MTDTSKDSISTIEDRDFAFYETMNEMLLTIMDQAEKARQADNDWKMEWHLKMMSRAVKYALLTYADRLELNIKEERKNEVHSDTRT